MTENRRRLERQPLDVHINILDMQTEQLLGSLVNVHGEGLMIVGPVAIEADRVYQIQLRPTGDAAVIGNIELGIDCIWSTGEDSSFWAGCRIIDCSEHAQQQIDQLNKRFSAVPSS